MSKWILRGILVLIALLIVVVAGVSYWQYQYWNTPWGDEEQRFFLEIPQGSTGREIAEQLREKGVIEDVNTFLILADLRGVADQMEAGEYEIRGEQTRFEVLNNLAEGNRYRHTVLIPEGWTQLQIVEKYDEMEICPKEDLMAHFEQLETFTNVAVAGPRGINAKIEGSLFPDTFYLEKNTPPVKISDRHLRRFDDVISELHDEATAEGQPDWWWQNEDDPEIVQVHNITVLASIVEREAKEDIDRAKMAAVFVNRLEKGMPLQSDATIHYALGDWSRPLTTSDLEVNSPYNTYQNVGLPPAAICNPGKASLRAAMMPADIDALYFLSMPDGQTRYTADYDEFINWKNERKAILAE